ncbi:hypothetical protein JCM3766R1_000535 [Sporobolomyces carnicolor]
MERSIIDHAHAVQSMKVVEEDADTRALGPDSFALDAGSAPQQVASASSIEMDEHSASSVKKRKQAAVVEGGGGPAVKKGGSVLKGKSHVAVSPVCEHFKEDNIGHGNDPAQEQGERRTSNDQNTAQMEDKRNGRHEQANESMSSKVAACREWSGVIEKNEEEAKDILRAIFDSKLSVSVGSVLALSNDLANTVASEVRSRRVPVPTRTTTSQAFRPKEEEKVDNLPHAKRNRVKTAKRSAPSPSTMLFCRTPAYVGPVGKLLIELEGMRMAAIFDTGSEINLCPKRTYSKTRLPLQEGNVFLTDANSGCSQLLGIVENVDIGCGPLKTRQHFYVQKEATYDLLLGMPFIRGVNASTWFDDEESLWCRMRGPGGQTVAVCMTRPDDPRHVLRRPVASQTRRPAPTPRSSSSKGFEH